MKKIIVLLALLLGPSAFFFYLWQSKHHFHVLPYYGPRTPTTKLVDGETVTDTIYHTIPPFSFVNQDGKRVSQTDFEDRIYVANFFFTSCPTICPKMTAQLKRAAFTLRELNDFRILSHTVDPKNDTVETLKRYAEKNKINTEKWFMVTGSKESIYDVALNGYFLNAMEDSDAPGGFLHSEMMILVDKNKNIRGIYDGTDTEEVDRLMEEVRLLKKEEDRKAKALLDGR